MTDTALHELCKGYGALLSRSKRPSFPEEAARLNERGNLPLHAACSFQAGADVVDALIKAYPGAVSQPNSAGNLPIHQAAMWQAPVETVELLVQRYPEGATVRNQYGSLPLHMAASNQATPEVVRLLIHAYADAMHLQNDDGLTPLDLALADESACSEAVLAMLEGRPPPPELTRRQKAEKYEERAAALEKKMAALRNAGGRQDADLKIALSAVRRLADRFPHALYAAGMDPNELELAFSDQMMLQQQQQQQQQHAAKLMVRTPHNNNAASTMTKDEDAEIILLDAVRKRATAAIRDRRGMPMANNNNGSSNSKAAAAASMPRDRVEDLLSSIVGLEHVKSQVRGLRRTAELRDLRESLWPMSATNTGLASPTAVASGSRKLVLAAATAAASASSGGPLTLVAPALAEDVGGRPMAPHMVFAGNPGTGKTAVARLLAKVFHELGLLRKPKFLEVERMDLVARDKETTVMKTREVLEEARGGILLIDEAFQLGMSSRRNRLDTAQMAMMELCHAMDAAVQAQPLDDSFPLVILAGCPLETQAFLAFNPEIRKRFSVGFEFPDYTCSELARIFMDLASAKGLDMEDSITEPYIAALLEQETTVLWRSERNGRVSEMLLTGVRGEVRKRMRRAQMEEQDDFDPHMVLKEDLQNVMRTDFK